MEQQPHVRPSGYRGRLSGKSIIVTGGASLFGLYLAQALLDEGASVLLSSFNLSEEPVFVESDGGKMIWASGDPRDPQYCLALTQYACRAFGRLDGVINNAAYEFDTVWRALGDQERPPASPRPTGFHHAIHDTEDNFNNAALEVMGPGGVVIHTRGPAPVPAEPVALMAGRHPLIGTRPRGSDCPESLLERLGIHVETVYPGTSWAAGLVESCPRRLPDRQARAFARQNESLIKILAEN